MLRYTRFLPDALDLKTKVDPDVAKFWRMLQRAQSPRDCSSTTLIAKGGWNTGLGGEINGMIKPLLLSMQRGYTMISPEIKWYGKNCDPKTSKNFKGAMDVRCFFEPASRCDQACTTTQAKSPDSSLPQCKLEDCTSCLNGKLGNWFQDGSYVEKGVSVLPKAFRDRKDAFLWVTAHLTAYLMRPNRLMALSLQLIKQRLHFENHRRKPGGATGGIIGMHVRQNVQDTQCLLSGQCLRRVH